MKNKKITGNRGLDSKPGKQACTCYLIAHDAYKKGCYWFIHGYFSKHIHIKTNFSSIHWDLCRSSFLLFIDIIHKTSSITKHINYLSFCWNKVSRKGVVMAENISVVSKTSNPYYIPLTLSIPEFLNHFHKLHELRRFPK